MIRYYAYFNYGGYKDLYLGCDKDVDISRYFLPLLPVMEQEEGMSEEVSRLKALPPIINLSSDTLEFNYPQDARVMMSHSGYKLQYRMIGKTGVVALRDISGNKDMYGRSCSFLMMIVGETLNDIKRLNIITYYLWKYTAEAEKKFSSFFVNDFAVNGLRFDVRKINTWFDEIVNADEGELAANECYKTVPFLVVSEGLSLANALAEQKITERDIAIAFNEKEYSMPCYGNQIPIRHGDKKVIVEEVEVKLKEIPYKPETVKSKEVPTDTPKVEENTLDFIPNKKTLLAMIASLEERIKELEHKMDITWHKDC